MSCCAPVRRVQFQYTDRPATAEDCDLLDGFIGNTEATFPVTAFCGAGDDRYAAIVEVDLCCAEGDCTGDRGICQSNAPILATLRAFGDNESQVMTPVSICSVANQLHWVIRLDCIFDSDALPTHWKLDVDDNTLRPWRLTVTYVCCFAGNCEPTATATPTATSTPSGAISTGNENRTSVIQ